VSAPAAADTEGRAAPARRRLALNTLIFSAATALSRIAGLIREVVASSYFGVSGPFSAFTLAFQIPNLVRSLVADSALSAAFVPVFTELLEHGRRRDAFRLASSLFALILIVLGGLSALFVLAAPAIVPVFTGDQFTRELDQLAIGLSQVMFPIVVLLGVNGLVVGILNAYDHFSIPALSPLVWNAVIIAGLVGLRGLFDGPDQLYAYALGVLAGTLVQLLMVLPVLRRVGFRFARSLDLRDPRIRRVLALMLPVTIGLGIINFDVFLNTTLGTLVSEQAPRAIDAAFRIYMLPQGMFSVALATVLFPTLSRFAARRDRDGLRRSMATGLRLVFLLLVPAAAFTLVLAEPITRLVYQRGAFTPADTDRVALALFWFSFSLPFSGANLMLTRTFFSLQKPWAPTLLAAGSLVINAGLSVLLYRPLGIAGLVIGTAAGSLAMAVAQAAVLRRHLHGIEAGRTLAAVAQIVAAAAALGATAWVTWRGFDALAGRSLLGQLVSVGAALTAGLLVYAGSVLLLRLPEAAMIAGLVERRVRR
jgi:putative peptidoglycan lipid II flippase